MICLDNSVLSRFASPRTYPEVTRYLSEHSGEPWTVPATVAYEYYAYFDSQAEIRSQKRALESRLEGILPVTDDVAAEAAQMEVTLEKQDIPLATADLLHAATAREAGATFVTRDADDFDSDPIRQLFSVDIIRP